MDMNSLLESIYKNDIETNRLEKTAESKMLDELRHSEQSNNPYMEYSTDELIKMAQELQAEETFVENDSDLEKVAFDMLGGQVMAHALVHELGTMKIAMANGLCRVCKTNHMDVDGSTICSECLGE